MKEFDLPANARKARTCIIYPKDVSARNVIDPENCGPYLYLLRN